MNEKYSILYGLAIFILIFTCGVVFGSQTKLPLEDHVVTLNQFSHVSYIPALYLALISFLALLIVLYFTKKDKKEVD